MKTKLIASLSLVVALLTASCGSQYGGYGANQYGGYDGYGMQNPYTNPNTPAAHKDALTGGAIGAIAGYYLGKQSDRRGEGAALGAALGAATGYFVGQQKDRQWQNYDQGYQQPYQQNPYQGDPYQSYPNQGPYYK